MNHDELKSQLMGAAMQPFIKSLFDRLLFTISAGISRAALYAYVKERNGRISATDG